MFSASPRLRVALTAVLLAGAGQAATFYVTVTGLGGEPDYEQRFAMWGREIGRALEGAGRVETLIAPRREAVREVFGSIAREAKGEDGLVVMLIGHGSFDGQEYKFNLPGPDMTGREIAELMDRVPARRQLVVNMTSSSGGSIEAFRRPERVIICATKSGTEKNATVFARYWAEALRDPAADSDKNESISAVEAFRYAQRKTASYYETEKRLASEHPVIEGGNFTLVRIGGAAVAARDPAKQKLLAEKEQLEAQIDRLKEQKAAMPSAEYKKQLTALLLRLAQVADEVEK